jgi:hypothetical protein
MHERISRAKYKSVELAWAMRIAIESVRIHGKLGMVDKESRDAADWLRELESEMCDVRERTPRE